MTPWLCLVYYFVISLTFTTVWTDLIVFVLHVKHWYSDASGWLKLEDDPNIVWEKARQMIFTMISYLVPPEYCLAPFNGSDCQLPAKPVFYYYKPGSRCEIKMWRGCPTLNKFDNEYLCSLNCIFRMKIESPEIVETSFVVTESFQNKLEDLDNENLKVINDLLDQLVETTTTEKYTTTEEYRTTEKLTEKITTTKGIPIAAELTTTEKITKTEEITTTEIPTTTENSSEYNGDPDIVENA